MAVTSDEGRFAAETVAFQVGLDYARGRYWLSGADLAVQATTFARNIGR